MKTTKKRTTSSRQGGSNTFENDHGWKTPDDSWLELEDESEEEPIYRVNVIIEEEEESRQGIPPRRIYSAVMATFAPGKSMTLERKSRWHGRPRRKGKERQVRMKAEEG